MKVSDWPLSEVRDRLTKCGLESVLPGGARCRVRGRRRPLHHPGGDDRRGACRPRTRSASRKLADALLVQAILEPDEAKVVDPSLLPAAREWRRDARSPHPGNTKRARQPDGEGRQLQGSRSTRRRVTSSLPRSPLYQMPASSDHRAVRLDPVWRREPRVRGQLIFPGVSRAGRSAPNAEFLRHGRAPVTMFTEGSRRRHAPMAGGHITGTFTFTKRGQNYGAESSR